MTALMGSSGAGKTTLLDVLSARKTTGEIRFNGEESTYEIQFLEFEGFTCVFAY